MKESVLRDKSVGFAIRIVNLYKFLCEQKQELVMSKQVLRSGTSIGANIQEGIYAESASDFIHKYSIAQKECAETSYWLELLYKTHYITSEQYNSISADCHQLLKMITSTLLTTKQRIQKLPKNHP